MNTAKLSPIDADAVSYARTPPGVTLAMMAARLGLGKVTTADVVRRLVSLGYLQVTDGIITTT